MALAKETPERSTYPFGVGLSHYDEAFESPGIVREHYAVFFDGFLALGEEEISRRWGKVRQRIQDNGVTFCVYGQEREEERAWKLDPIPLLVPASDWARLEKGLRQRAELLDTVLADLYGEQRLIREGALPPELVFANPSFLRPCRRIQKEGSRWLRNYAADLARSPDGAWWIIDDRTQAPSGLGYALENRMAIRQFFPEIFRESPAARLVDFYNKYRDGLLALPGARFDPSRVAVLSPGPHNEIYFEHSYLARFLGFSLVEGGDLTVRDNKVYIKTLEGLKEIGAILRKMDDDFCDPLELRPDSVLGVPGLLQAARAGNVAIANMIGSGALESRALLPFLPALCRRFFGEDLILPSVATWWCGQPEELQFVLDRFETMTIKPAFPSPKMDPFTGRDLSAEERKKRIEQIRRRPHLYIAQEQVALSSAPVWENGRIEPRHLTLRCQIIADDAAGGYVVMPGGLGRVTASAESTDVSMHMGGGSKDVWVLTERAAEAIDTSGGTLLTMAETPFLLARSAGRLPSRVADNLFWLGRYVERARSLIALSRSALAGGTQALNEERTPEESFRIDALARTLREFIAVPTPAPKPAAERKGDEEAGEEDQPRALETVVQQAIFDERAPWSLAAMLVAIRRAARPVSDRFSDDCWQLLNRIESVIVQGEDGGDFPGPDGRDRLREMTVLLSAFGGMIDDGMVRSAAWRFLEIGRCLERAVCLVLLLRGTMLEGGAETDALLLGSVLDAADSAMTYRSRYFDRIRAAAIIDLTVLDESNPHSVAFQLSRLMRHIEKLPRRPGENTPSAEFRRLFELHRTLLSGDPHRLAARGEESRRAVLADLLTRISGDLRRLSDELSLAYFSHSEPVRTLRDRAAGRVATLAVPPPEASQGAGL